MRELLAHCEHALRLYLARSHTLPGVSSDLRKATAQAPSAVRCQGWQWQWQWRRDKGKRRHPMQDSASVARACFRVGVSGMRMAAWADWEHAHAHRPACGGIVVSGGSACTGAMPTRPMKRSHQHPTATHWPSRAPFTDPECRRARRPSARWCARGQRPKAGLQWASQAGVHASRYIRVKSSTRKSNINI